MRPVERGPEPRRFQNYREAINDLERRLGHYCSYCEIRVPIGLAVEHKIPRAPCPALELEWTNFLLGCVTCNSIKGDKVKTIGETLWPDLNNTLLALKYSEGGFVDVSQCMSDELNERAQSLAKLVGLDRHKAAGWPAPTKRDKRWSEREKVWRTAENCRAYYTRLGQSQDALELVIDAAVGFGFFSVWWTVFEDFSVVRNKLIASFPGTSANCFARNGDLIPRPNAVI